MRCYTLDSLTGATTGEGADIYSGAYASEDGSIDIPVTGAWYPSRSQFIIRETDTPESGFYEWYAFTIDGDGRLSGDFCFHLYDTDNCVALSPESRRLPLGEWGEIPAGGDGESPGSDGTFIPPVDELPGGGGDVKITLQWNADVDLDLHAIDPCGNEIYFANSSATCQGNAGFLDLDEIVGGPGSAENIFWPTGGAPGGTYTYWVSCFSRCDDVNAAFVLTRIVDGEQSTNSGTLNSSGQESTRFTFSR